MPVPRCWCWSALPCSPAEITGAVDIRWIGTVSGQHRWAVLVFYDMLGITMEGIPSLHNFRRQEQRTGGTCGHVQAVRDDRRQGTF